MFGYGHVPVCVFAVSVGLCGFDPLKLMEMNCTRCNRIDGWMDG